MTLAGRIRLAAGPPPVGAVARLGEGARIAGGILPNREDRMAQQGIPRFELYIDAARQWRWRLRAPNGEIIASGEGYQTEQNCRAGIEDVKRYAPIAPIFRPG